MMFTAEEKWMEVRRELKKRMQIYPRLIEGGELSEQAARQRIGIMQEIAADYEKLAQGERLI
jgi:hypothetical protein